MIQLKDLEVTKKPNMMVVTSLIEGGPVLEVNLTDATHEEVVTAFITSIRLYNTGNLNLMNEGIVGFFKEHERMADDN